MRFSEFNDVTRDPFFSSSLLLSHPLLLRIHTATIPFLCSIDIYCPFIKINNMFTSSKYLRDEHISPKKKPESVD